MESDSSESSRLQSIKYNVHSFLQEHSPEELRSISKKLHLPVHLMLFNVDGNMNIAMSIRTAAVFGCSDVWVVGKRRYDARPEVGAKNYIEVHKVLIDDPLTFFKEQNLEPILVEQGGVALEKMNFKPFVRSEKPVCLIMGSESHGIPEDILEKMKGTPRVSISQCGMIRSLNVSIAGSIVMYEYLKQMREVEESRLSLL